MSWWREAIANARQGNDDTIYGAGSACSECVGAMIDAVEEDLAELAPPSEKAIDPPTPDEIVDALQAAGVNLAYHDHDEDMKVANAVVALCAQQWGMTLIPAPSATPPAG